MFWVKMRPEQENCNLGFQMQLSNYKISQKNTLKDNLLFLQKTMSGKEMSKNDIQTFLSTCHKDSLE